jgi:hypothetical protein
MAGMKRTAFRSTAIEERLKQNESCSALTSFGDEGGQDV